LNLLIYTATMIYRAIVRHQVRSLFEKANRGDWSAIVDGLASAFSYRFIGETPLGGTRTKHQSMRAWFERLYRLFPKAVFDPQTIIVEGPPWKTLIMTYVKISGSAPGPDGTSRPYENEFMQRMVLRWGKITSVLTLEDTQRFVNILPALAASGIADATAEQIVDD
jgi:ketosteroid isomerase-like protein